VESPHVGRVPSASVPDGVMPVLIAREVAARVRALDGGSMRSVFARLYRVAQHPDHPRFSVRTTAGRIRLANVAEWRLLLQSHGVEFEGSPAVVLLALLP
jgi:hypothetical protein